MSCLLLSPLRMPRPGLRCSVTPVALLVRENLQLVVVVVDGEGFLDSQSGEDLFRFPLRLVLRSYEMSIEIVLRSFCVENGCFFGFLEDGLVDFLTFLK